MEGDYGTSKGNYGNEMPEMCEEVEGVPMQEPRSIKVMYGQKRCGVCGRVFEYEYGNGRNTACPWMNTHDN